MNYKETTVNGSSWVRCRAVTINNPLPGNTLSDMPQPDGATGPVVYFQEEKVVSLDGSNIHMDAGSCHKPFDPAATIPLLDPTTGEPTGTTVTHAELYAILFSLYMQTALERDAAALG